MKTAKAFTQIDLIGLLLLDIWLCHAFGEVREYQLELALPKAKQSADIAATAHLNSPVITQDSSLWGVDSDNHQLLYFRADGSFMGYFNAATGCL